MHGKPSKEQECKRTAESVNFNMNQPAPLPSSSLPLDRIRIVLSHPNHPGNIGAAARAIKTMGLKRLVLVTPRHFPHPDAAVMAAGADDVLAAAQVTATLAEALKGTVLAVGMTARRRDLSHPQMPVREAAQRALGATLHGDVAFVFGTETFGLPNEELDLCQLGASIPADLQFSSLNLAASVQIAAYEIAQAAEVWQPPQANAREPATHDAVEAFYAHLERSMIESGFLNAHKPRRLMTRLRRLFARARLEKEEVNILRGILAAMERKRDR
jgi:tRNA/rRNA methyltransferase